MTDELTRMEVVYLGRVHLSDGKTGVMIAPRELVMTNPKAAWSAGSPFGKPKKGLASFSAIGTVYSVEGATGEGGRITTYRPGSLEFVGKSDVPAEVVAVWEAKDESLALAERAKSREKTLTENTELTRQVGALRQTYKGIGYGHRLAFKLWLIEELDRR
jgi:hypothetical protein